MSNRSTVAVVTLWPWCGRWPDGTRKYLDAHLYRDVVKQRYELAIGTSTYPRFVIPLGRGKP